jgi:Zn-dependent protease
MLNWYMEFVFLIAILIFSVVLHEVSHGVVANALGDPTAKNAGRLTLNPIPHLDPIGSILLPGLLILLSQLGSGGIIFGWAKPVPVNPMNLPGKYDSALVSLAGPGSNLALALVFGLALRFLPLAELNPALVLVFSYIVFLNILLAIFNLLPIPPLDGSHILFSFLPKSFDALRIFLSQFGLFVLLFIVFFFFSFVSAIVNFLFRLIVGAPFF